MVATRHVTTDNDGMNQTPLHPGAILWADYLEPLQMSVTDLADALGVARKTLSALINGRQGVSPEMSIRLSLALGTEPDAWAKRQLDYDMSVTDRRGLKVKRLARRRAKAVVVLLASMLLSSTLSAQQMPTTVEQLGVGAARCSQLPVAGVTSDTDRQTILAVSSWLQGYLVGAVDWFVDPADPRRALFVVPDQNVAVQKLVELCATDMKQSIREVASTLVKQLYAHAKGGAR